MEAAARLRRRSSLTLTDRESSMMILAEHCGSLKSTGIIQHPGRFSLPGPVPVVRAAGAVMIQPFDRAGPVRDRLAEIANAPRHVHYGCADDRDRRIRRL